jgi:hypothetical protein
MKIFRMRVGVGIILATPHPHNINLIIGGYDRSIKYAPPSVTLLVFHATLRRQSHWSLVKISFFLKMRKHINSLNFSHDEKYIKKNTLIYNSFSFLLFIKQKLFVPRLMMMMPMMMLLVNVLMITSFYQT